MLLLVLLYGAIWAVGYLSHKLPCFLSTLNIATALAVLGYWATRQWQIKQHYFEWREMIVLGLELLIFVAAVYVMATGNKYKCLLTIQYFVFSIHFLALVTMLIFLLTFKMNKLT